MTAKSTEQRIIKVIAEHYLEDGQSKLTIQEVSNRSGITRQAFNRNYKHLKPYVVGSRPIEDILTGNIEELRSLLVNSQKRVRQLNEEITKGKFDHLEEIKNIKNSYITTLMNDDIALSESDEIRKTLEKQAMHNESLVSSIKKLERELTVEKARAVSHNINSSSSNDCESELIPVSPDIETVFNNYIKSKNIDIYEDEKDLAINKVIKRINKFSIAEDSCVVLFIDRYLCSFDNFVKQYKSSNIGPTIIVKLPLFTRTELKLFSKKIQGEALINIYVPFSDSETTIKAQRAFLFRSIPEPEINSADRMAFPSIIDGHNMVSIFRIYQGD
ncbi:hypothetical protein A9Q75_01485 [Colwellia psychrerythraea]|uniref:Uncharacterized protein n=1 Tax=Colwellia psychrerythraea TaxID=28229 RepID=A0A1Y5EPU1_COLPS|nr:hypothetical protein A9Q75_01485 [Colwellia psychrerythraea]